MVDKTICPADINKMKGRFFELEALLKTDWRMDWRREKAHLYQRLRSLGVAMPRPKPRPGGGGYGAMGKA